MQTAHRAKARAVLRWVPTCSQLLNNAGLSSVPSSFPLRAGHLCMHTHTCRQHVHGILTHIQCMHMHARVHMQTCMHVHTAHTYTHACIHRVRSSLLHSVTGNTALWPPDAPTRPLGCPDHQKQEDNMDGWLFLLQGGFLYQQTPGDAGTKQEPLHPKPDKKSRS